MPSILTLQFWFNLRPGSMETAPKIFLLIFLIFLLLVSIIFFVAKRKKSFYKPAFSSLYNFSLSNLVIGSALLFFNYELVPFFSAYFWYLIWFLVFIWWLIGILKKIKRLLIKKREVREEDTIKKYLP